MYVNGGMVYTRHTDGTWSAVCNPRVFSINNGGSGTEITLDTWSNPIIKIGRSSGSITIGINSSGKIEIIPSSKSAWKTYSGVSTSGEVYVDGDGFLKIKNW